MDNEEINFTSYNRFSYLKKHIIQQHKYTQIDGSVPNTMKQSKNSPGLAIATPPNSYSSSPKSYEKRESSLNHKTEKREDSLIYKTEKREDSLKYKTEKREDSLNYKTEKREDSLNYKTEKREDSLNYKTEKREDSLNYKNIKNIEDNQQAYQKQMYYKQNHEFQKQKDYRVEKENIKKSNNSELSSSLRKMESRDPRNDMNINNNNNNQYKSPSMSQSNISVTSSVNGYNGPLFQSPDYRKFNDEGMDISVGEILVYGLKAMLKSKVPLCYFLHTLIEDYCCENLFFYLEIEQYKVFTFEDAKSQLKAAQYIYVTYLDTSSKIEVNIDEKIRKEIFNQLKTNKCDLSTVFDKASEAVFNLMESTFAKFNRSSIKQQMIDELDNTNYYSDEHKICAIRILISYLDKRRRELEDDEEIMMMNVENKQNVSEGMPISPEQILHITNVQRNKLIYALTHEFIRAFLELDFDDEAIPGEVCVFRPPIQYIQNVNEDPLKHISSSPISKRINRKDIQISIITDNKGQQFQVIVTPPIPIASFYLDGYKNYKTINRKNSSNPFKKFIKSVKLTH